jgi:hypothetical protein
MLSWCFSSLPDMAVFRVHSVTLAMITWFLVLLGLLSLDWANCSQHRGDWRGSRGLFAPHVNLVGNLLLHKNCR